MKVLLTGASGFLGQYVLNSLQQQGIETVILGRKLPCGSALTALTPLIEADLLSAPDFPALIQKASATHLLHLAWYTEHGKYWTSPLNLRWVNASTQLIEAFCQAGGQRVVMAGTCAEYDWSHGYCREESTPLNPATLYGTAKDAARRLVMAICTQYKVPCAWGRVFLPFGAGENNQRLIPSLMEVFRGQRRPFGVNTSAYRDFLHASDVAEGFITLLQSAEDGAYNISSGQPVPLENTVHYLAKLFNADPQQVLNLSTERPGEPDLLVGDNHRLRALGWYPALSLAQGLEKVVKEITL